MGLLEKARREAENLAREQGERIAREEELVLREAASRAESIRRRQVMSAEREKTADALRLQNRLMTEAVSMLEEEFTRLREREATGWVPLVKLALELRPELRPPEPEPR